MSTEKLIFVTDKYVSTLEKGDMMQIPFQVIKELGLTKGDRVEWEFIRFEDENEGVAFTVKKHGD